MAKTIQINIKADTSQTVKSINDLENAIASMEDQLKSEQLGSKEFKRLQGEIGKARNEMEKIEQSSAKFSDKSVAMGDNIEKLGAGIAGAFSVATGVVGAFGESLGFSAEDIANAQQKAMSFIAIMQGLKPVLEGVKAAQALLNVVMAANPIGLIVVAVGALIAAFIAFREPIIEFLSNWENLRLIMLALLGPIGWIIIAYEKLFGEEAKLADAREEQSKAQQERTKKEIDQIKERRRIEQEAHEERQKNFDLQIARLDAEGKSSRALTKQKLEDVLAEKKAMLQSNIDIINAQVKRYEFEAALRGMSLKDFLQSINIQYDVVEKQINDNLQLQKDSIFEAETELIKFNTESSKLAKEASEERLNDEHKSILAKMQAEILAAKSVQERAELEIAYIKKRNEFILMDEELTSGEIILLKQEEIDEIKKINDDLLEYTSGIRQKEIDEVRKSEQEKFDIQVKKELELKEEKERIQTAYSNWKENENLTSIQEENQRYSAEYDIALDAFEKGLISQEQFNADIEEINKKHENNLLTIKLEGIAKRVDAVAGYVNSALALYEQVDAFLDQRDDQRAYEREKKFSEEEEALKASLANREMSQKEYDNKLILMKQQQDQADLAEKRKSFRRDKSFNLAKAIISTSQAIAQALASSIPPLNFINAGITGALGGVQIATIASSKFQAAKGGVVPGSGPGHIDSVPSLLAPGEMVINSNSAKMFPQLLSALNQAGGGISLAPDIPITGGNSSVYRENQQVVKAYVVEQEITDKQKKADRMRRSAQFG